MSNLHPYRASDELAAALREHRTLFNEFVRTVREFDDTHPDHQIMWKRSAMDPQDDTVACGFRDGADEVPDGLSRAQSRPDLRPKKTTAGREWQDVLDRMTAARPMVGPVLARFDVPGAVSGGVTDSLAMRVTGTQWGDAGADGVLVYALGPLTKPAPFGSEVPLSPHVTPIPLSEFYAIKERLDAERATGVDA